MMKMIITADSGTSEGVRGSRGSGRGANSKNLNMRKMRGVEGMGGGQTVEQDVFNKDEL